MVIAALWGGPAGLPTCLTHTHGLLADCIMRVTLGRMGEAFGDSAALRKGRSFTTQSGKCQTA